MKKSKPNKNRYNFLIDRDVYDDFSAICEELGLVRSKQVENLIKTLIRDQKEVLKKLKK